MNQRTLPLNGMLQRKKEPDSDSFIDLDRLFASILRRAPTIGLATAVTVMLGIVYLVFSTSIYGSMTQILLDESRSRYADDELASQQQNKQQVDTQISSAVEILKSNELALRVVDTADLANNDTILNPPKSLAGTVKSWLGLPTGLFSSPPSEAAVHEGKRQKAAALLQQGIAVERVGRSAVVSVSYRSPDPQLAAKVTRAYAQAYLADQLSSNFDAAEHASVWLQERLDSLGERARAASLEAESYKAANGLTSTRGELMSEQQLTDLTSQLIVAQADTAKASARYNQYKAITAQGPENAIKNAVVTSTDASNTVIQDLRSRYLSIEQREREVTGSFGADHPQAVALKAEKTDVGQQIFQELQRLTDNYRNEYEVTQSQETSLRRSIESVTGTNSSANTSLIHLRELEQKATSLKSLYESYLQRYEQATQQQSLPIAQARVISEAGVPVAPMSPKKTMVLALSIVLGLMGGGAIAFFQEMRENTFRLVREVRSVLGQTPLGYLPLVGAPPQKPLERMRAFLRYGPKASQSPSDIPLQRMTRLILEAPRSAFAETLRNAKLATDIILQGRPSRVIGIVSALPGEGKTTVAANFAMLLAATGKRTLLIDADMREARMSRMLKPAPKAGLVEAIIGNVSWTSLVRVDPQSKLAILPMLPPPLGEELAFSTDILGSSAMANLIESARQVFEYVIVDLAPLVPAIVDAKAFAPRVDGFIFVVEWGKTPTRLVADLLEAEPVIASKILGVLLNRTDMARLAKYGDFGGPEKYRKHYDNQYQPKPPQALLAPPRASQPVPPESETGEPRSGAGSV